MVQINVGSTNGITYAIKAEIEKRGEKITNNNLSIWQSVMSEIKSSQNTTKNLYTGGDDIDNLNNKKNWKSDFQVNKNQIMELAEESWNKIVNLLTGKTTETKPKTSVLPESNGNKPAADIPKDVTVKKDLGNNPTPISITDYAINKGLQDPISMELKANSTPLTNMTGPSPAENPKYDAIARGSLDKSSAPLKTSSENEQLEAYLEKDSTFQKYNNILLNMKDEIDALKQQYGIIDNTIDRDTNWKEHLDIEADNLRKYIGMSDEDRSKYDYYKELKADLSSYKNLMKNWQNGRKANKFDCTKSVNGYILKDVHYTNVTLITLKNGERAYKADQGTFYPDRDGYPSKKSVPADLISD